MAGLGLSGLASGVDTAGIIDQLMALERGATTRLQLAQKRVDARSAGLKDVQGKLSALRTAAETLKSASTWTSAQTVESSDPARVSASLIAGAAARTGGASVNVIKLAAAEQKAYGYVPPSGAATLSLAYADGTGAVSVALAAGATIQDAAAAINANTGGPVSARVVVEGGQDRLVLVSRKTGDPSDFTVSSSEPAVLAAKTDVESIHTRARSRAEYTIDGGASRFSDTNTVDDAILGVRLGLRAIGTAGVNVGSPGVDHAAVKAKVKAFVDAHNALIDSVNAKVSEKVVPKATTTTEATKGQLFGDSGLSGLVSRLRLEDVKDHDGGTDGPFDSLADLGISTGRSTGATATTAQRLGKLEIDDAKLSAALETNPDQVRALLGKVADSLTAFASGQDDVLKGRVEAAGTDTTRLGKQMTLVEERIAAKEKRLRAQFAAMESAMAAAQTQQAWLSGQLAALNPA